MITSDIEKDIKIATAEEDAAKAEYATFKTDTEALLESLGNEKADLDGRVGDAEGIVSDSKKERKDKKEQLDNTMAFLRSIAPSCDYMAVNFELRKQNRESEIDGLVEAGASLGGASFTPEAGLLQEEC